MVGLSSYTNIIKQNYYNAFLASLFIPKPLRDKLWTCLSFYHELSSITHKVNEELLGMIRFAWWHEQIKSSETPAHPILIAIKSIIAENDKLADHFIKLIDYYQSEYKEEAGHDNPHLDLINELFVKHDKYLAKYNEIYDKLEHFDHVKIKQGKLPDRYKLRKVLIAIWGSI